MVVIVKSPALAPLMDLPVIAMADEPLFLRETMRELLVWPTTMLPKPTFDGLAVAVPTVRLAPTPERATVWGLFAALSLKLRVAVRVPVAVGAKAMLTVQLDEAARVEPQVLESCTKSAGSAPSIVTPEISIEFALPFISATVIPELVVPVLVCGKLSLVGETVTSPDVDGVPVPES